MTQAGTTPTVRAEPVEVLFLYLGEIEGKGFDKLSPNGFLYRSETFR